MDSLCHPWFTTTNLSYRFPIFETSATALCGTTGTLWLYQLYHRVIRYARTKERLMGNIQNQWWEPASFGWDYTKEMGSKEQIWPHQISQGSRGIRNMRIHSFGNPWALFRSSIFSVFFIQDIVSNLKFSAFKTGLWSWINNFWMIHPCLVLIQQSFITLVIQPRFILWDQALYGVPNIANI